MLAKRAEEAKEEFCCPFECPAALFSALDSDKTGQVNLMKIRATRKDCDYPLLFIYLNFKGKRKARDGPSLFERILINHNSLQAISSTSARHMLV